jgi:hypothetical protein
MMRPWCRLLFVLGGVFMLTACATASPTGPGPGSGDAALPITSIDAVKGKWAGVVERTKPNSRQEDFVELTINDDASFAYSGARTLGMFHGSGTLALADGQLMYQSERGRVTYRLYDRNGIQVIKVDAESTDGLRYEAVLRR